MASLAAMILAHDTPVGRGTQGRGTA